MLSPFLTMYVEEICSRSSEMLITTSKIQMSQLRRPKYKFSQPLLKSKAIVISSPFQSTDHM